jgi:hypothetical protein
MGEACGTFGGVQKYINGIDGEIWRKQATWKS